MDMFFLEGHSVNLMFFEGMVNIQNGSGCFFPFGGCFCLKFLWGVEMIEFHML